jgi:hypothetical protein
MIDDMRNKVKMFQKRWTCLIFCEVTCINLGVWSLLLIHDTISHVESIARIMHHVLAYPVSKKKKNELARQKKTSKTNQLPKKPNSQYAGPKQPKT